MRTAAGPVLLILALAACRAAPQAPPSPPRYVVTAVPIDVGVVSKELCVGVDPHDPRGVWWWEPGSSGCATRSTGPDVFPAEQAAVKVRSGADPIEVCFRMQLKRAPGSTLPAFADVQLVVEDNAIRAVASGVKVAAARRADLDLSLEPPRR